MSKISDMLDKKVSVEFAVSDWILIHEAMEKFKVESMSVSHPILHEDNEKTRVRIKHTLYDVLDREFPIEGRV